MDAMRNEIVALQQRLVLAEEHGVQAAEVLEKLRSETDAARKQANARIDGGYHREDRLEPLDVKSMLPKVFKGSADESYKQWAKKVKAYCNSRKDGFRKALEWAEAETVPVDENSLTALA